MVPGMGLSAPLEQPFLPLPQHCKRVTLEISSMRANFDPKSYSCIVFNQKTKVKEEIDYFVSLSMNQITSYISKVA